MATLPRNSPDYNVPIDMATSYVPDEARPPFVHCVQLSNLCSTNYSTFTPVPKQVQNGSEENVLPAGLISGAPIELQARTVRYVSVPATSPFLLHFHHPLAPGFLPTIH
jgi:NADH dehydrogenase (ubiquinone) Fe-S protein 4